MELTIRKVSEFLGTKSFGLKLPPYFDAVHFDTVADIIKRYERVKYVTCINSLGNGLIIDTEKESVTIKPKNGLGGIGGKYILPFALSNIYQFRQRLPDTIDIVGCGGVTSGNEVFQHILVGASAVQIGTTVREEGIKAFERIHNELVDIMKNKGYKKLNDFKGKLKSI
jgi:dihydroorotate dehydrogenase (fumarate)